MKPPKSRVQEDTQGVSPRRFIMGYKSETEQRTWRVDDYSILIKMPILKKLLPFIIIILSCVGAILPLFHPGFFTMHDNEQIARLYDLNQALLSGNIPPRIAPNLGFGYGYPFFNFYPSFAYYVGEVFHLMGFGYILSTKLMLMTGFILSAIFIYLFVKELFGKISGIVASVAYTYASYHAIDVYVRGDFAEFFAFVFLPLIFLSLHKIFKNLHWKFVLLLALSIAGLILSHNLITFMSAPFIGLWFLYLLIFSKDKKNFILFSFAGLVLGFGMSAFFWLPSYVEKNYTLINILTSELANYSLHFVCVRQLWDSPWGYGGSIPGCYDGLSFEIGKIQLVLSAVAVMVALFFLVKHKYLRQTTLTLLFAGMLALSAFLMVKFSKPIWDLIPQLWYVQFPWRYLLIAVFLSSVLCAALVWFIKNRIIKIAASIAIILSIIILGLPRFTPQRFFSATDESYTNIKKIRWETSLLSYEYVPNGIQTKKSNIGTTLVDINKNEIASAPASVIAGAMSINTIKNLPQDKRFQVSVAAPGVFQINTYSFPGWSVFIDNRKVTYTDNNKLKLIRLDLEKGSYIIDAKFLDTPIRTIGNTLSVISIIVLGFGFIFVKKKQKHA